MQPSFTSEDQMNTINIIDIALSSQTTQQQQTISPWLLVTYSTFYTGRVALDNVFNTFSPISIDRASRHISGCFYVKHFRFLSIYDIQLIKSQSFQYARFQ